MILIEQFPHNSRIKGFVLVSGTGNGRGGGGGGQMDTIMEGSGEQFTVVFALIVKEG